MRHIVDLCSLISLTNKKTELEGLLETINFAIERLPKNEFSNGSIISPHKPVFDVLKSLPDRFSTSDVMIAMGPFSKESRGTIKSALMKFQERKMIACVEKGSGRKPNTYVKLITNDSETK